MNKLNKILVINGPNLNLLGIREPHIYGKISLKEIENNLVKYGKKISYNVHCTQNNNEGKLVEIVQRAYEDYSGIIINAGGYTHTSIALMDALKFFSKIGKLNQLTLLLLCLLTNIIFSFKNLFCFKLFCIPS